MRARRSRVQWTGFVILTTALVAGTVPVASAAATGTRHHAASSGLTVTYKVSGSTTVVKTASTVALGPATLTATLRSTGHFTGTLPLPSTSTSFTAIGLVPVTATVTFVSAGPLTGKLVRHKKRTTITSSASYYIKLSNVTLAGLPGLVGNKCQTKAPVAIHAATPNGKKFDVTTGGTVTATYTIGDFAHCGPATVLINKLVPGPGNPLTLKLSDGQVAN
jgi:hypothetical protein